MSTRPESDVDLGLYYPPPLDVAAPGYLARDVAGPDARVSVPGDWDAWVDGGAWLQIAGTAVDWIYRDLDRVSDSWGTQPAGSPEDSEDHRSRARKRSKQRDLQSLPATVRV